MSRSASPWRVGADIGGTFTDIVALSPEAGLVRAKVLSTPSDYSVAISTGLSEMLDADRLADVWSFVHGTTVATNAILQESEQPIALVTTAGFRDVLDLRRGRRPTLYDLSWTPPRPLVPRRLRFEVNERIGSDGAIVTPLDMATVDACVEALSGLDVTAVAVCLINSHRNPAHEEAVAQSLRDGLRGVAATTSSSIAPEPREYERTSTTVINAYLLPIIEEYLERLETSLAEIGVTVPVQIMQSDGTNASAGIARQRPFLIIESGPAAGVIAAARLSRELGRRAVITFDMGGTTAKAGLVEDHLPRISEELEVGDAHNRAGGLMRGAGFPVRSPCIDLSEVGSGGGSIAWIDGGGVLRVGPRSAGSEPGPACYGLGGSEPTVTDAHLVLGYISPVAIAGGTRPLEGAKAHAAIGRLARELDMSTEQVAYGVFEVATANMRRAVRAVSVERGRDPRNFSLFAFGGAGGLHAAALATELEMDEVVVPMIPGLFSSLGLLFSELAVSRVRSGRVLLDEAGLASTRRLARELGAEASTELARAYSSEESPRLEAVVNMRYLGQSSTLPVRMTLDGDDGVAAISAAFHDEHDRVLGQSAVGADVEIVSVRVGAVLPPPEVTFAEIGRHYIASFDQSKRPTSRSLYFGPDEGWHDAVVADRGQLGAGGREGPLVIEEPEATILVPPGFAATLHPTGSIVVSRH
jgi:N-methylhydantoinase A